MDREYRYMETTKSAVVVKLMRAIYDAYPSNGAFANCPAIIIPARKELPIIYACNAVRLPLEFVQTAQINYINNPMNMCEGSAKGGILFLFNHRHGNCMRRLADQYEFPTLIDVQRILAKYPLPKKSKSNKADRYNHRAYRACTGFGAKVHSETCYGEFILLPILIEDGDKWFNKNASLFNMHDKVESAITAHWRN